MAVVSVSILVLAQSASGGDPPPLAALEPAPVVVVVEGRSAGHTAVWWAREAGRRAAVIRRLRARLRARHLQGTDAVQAVIRDVFGRYGSQAVAVSRCETGGTFWHGATNGQYHGIFQMGDYARGRYGDAQDARGQAEAAYRYFVASGRDWSPWECKPW